MIDACTCIEPDSFAETICNEIRTARKAHKCLECFGEIRPGAKYEYFFGKNDGDTFVHKTCMPCYNMRKSLFECGYYFGQIWQDLIESISETMTVDEIEEDEDWYQYILPETLREKNIDLEA